MGDTSVFMLKRLKDSVCSMLCSSLFSPPVLTYLQHLFEDSFLKVLPRIKIFAWRACNNGIPTRRGIFSRIKEFDPCCYICHCGHETVLHALRECKLAREIWNCSPLAYVAESSTLCIADWWESCFNELVEDEVAAVITLCWAIWNARNSFVMENEHKEPSQVVKYAWKTCEDFMREYAAPSTATRAADVLLPSTWAPPAAGCVKVNVDAGQMGSLGSGLGAVIRDSEGKICACAAAQSSDKWDPMLAEAKAVVCGLELARNMGFRKVSIESDCMLLIKALRDQTKGANNLHLIIEDILFLCNSFDFVCWDFVKRGGNKVAHALAHFQPWEVGLRVWNDVIPPCIVELASSDAII